MKLIALGDTHGRRNWEKITAKNDFDRVVFIGDYFDTHEDISAEQQIDNFKKIIAFKKANPEKVILLFGNHSFHYLKTIDEQYSGYQRFHAFDIQEALHKAIDERLLQMCYVSGNYLFSHAGVTQTWCRNNNIDINNIEEQINDLFLYKPNSFKFTVGENYDNYGDDICQTPIWVRPRSLVMDRISNYIHVVGHTTQDKLLIYETAIFIDTLGTSGEYLEITDGVAKAVKQR